MGVLLRLRDGPALQLRKDNLSLTSINVVNCLPVCTEFRLAARVLLKIPPHLRLEPRLFYAG
jgi:hypothetical protein